MASSLRRAAISGGRSVAAAVLLGEALKNLVCADAVSKPERHTSRWPLHRWSRFEAQPGALIPRHSASAPSEWLTNDAIPCYIASTTEETHRIIRENVHRSPCIAGRFNRLGRGMPVD